MRATFCGVVVLSAFALSAATAQPTGADSAIRAARADFNRAIAIRDLDAMARVIEPTYHLVAGRSTQAHGVDSTMARWRANFASDSLYGCVRTPTRIRVHLAWNMAQETGSWRCTVQSRPTTGHSSGVYVAKWGHDAGMPWRLKAEVFTTMQCTGAPSACVRPDTVRALNIATAAAHSAVPQPSKRSSEMAIRAARADFNAILKRRDSAALARVFVPTYFAQFSRNNTQIRGAEHAITYWREAFTDSTSNCVRTPDAVRVNESWGLAQETGRWRCERTASSGPLRPSGEYGAKWQRDLGGQWRVQAEVFTALRCRGSTAACAAP